MQGILFWLWQSHDFPEITQGQHKNNIQYIIFAVFMELPTWKGAYYPCHVSPLSMRLFNHARGVQSFARGLVYYWVSTLLMSLGRGPDASNWMHYINNTISTTITLFSMCGQVHRRIIISNGPKMARKSVEHFIDGTVAVHWHYGMHRRCQRWVPFLNWK